MLVSSLSKKVTNFWWMEEKPILPKVVIEATWARTSAAQRLALHQTDVIGLSSESPRGMNFAREVFTLIPLSEEERAWVLSLVTHALTHRLGPVRADDLHRISLFFVNANMSAHKDRLIQLDEKLLKRTCDRVSEIAKWRKSLSNQVPPMVVNKTVYWVGRDKGHHPVLLVDIAKAGGVTQEVINAVLISLEYARSHLCKSNSTLRHTLKITPERWLRTTQSRVIIPICVKTPCSASWRDPLFTYVCRFRCAGARGVLRATSQCHQFLH